MGIRKGDRVSRRFAGTLFEGVAIDEPWWNGSDPATVNVRWDNGHTDTVSTDSLRCPAAAERDAKADAEAHAKWVARGKPDGAGAANGIMKRVYGRG